MPPSDLTPALRVLGDLVATTLAATVREAVAAALVDALPEVIRRATLSPYLSKKEVCALTGWSARKLDYLVAERRIPFVKRGRSVLFKTADVEGYLGEGYVPAKTTTRTGTPQ